MEKIKKQFEANGLTQEFDKIMKYYEAKLMKEQKKRAARKAVAEASEIPNESPQ